jgi:REP-associated tyrosine transposase
MPRRPRLQIPGGVFHLTARGNRRQAIFTDDRDHERFLQILGRVVAGRRRRCHAYGLMPNHYHLLIETPVADLSAGMHQLNGVFARWFNWRHQLDGHLFQSRFHSTVVESQWHLFELSRYLVLNPVRAGLCSEPAEWRWSSYSALVGGAETPPFLSVEWLLAQFAPQAHDARRRFEGFVVDAAPEPR